MKTKEVKKQLVKKSTVKKIETKPESLAMLHHSYQEPKKKGTFKYFSGKKVTVKTFLESDPTMWGVAWALLWRGVILVSAVKFLLLVSTGIVSLLFTNLFLISKYL